LDLLPHADQPSEIIRVQCTLLWGRTLRAAALRDGIKPTVQTVGWLMS
jgi:hypothetical protein